jgi:hypothetical protein
MISGNLLRLWRLRDIRDECLILRAATAPRTNREFQAVLSVDPVPLLLLAEREQKSLYEAFRDYLGSRTPADGTLCIHVRIREEETGAYREQLEQTRMQHEAAAYRDMARSHLRFLDELEQSRSLLRREWYVRVSVTERAKKGTDVLARGLASLSTAVEGVMAGLSRAGLVSERLGDEQLRDYVLSCLHNEFAQSYGLPPDIRRTLDVPALISGWPWLPASWRKSLHLDSLPDQPSWPELLQPGSIQVRPHCLVVHQQTDEYVRGRAVIGYPATLVPGWFDQLLALDVPAEILLFVDTLDSARYVRHLSRKLTSFNATALMEERGGKTENPYVAAARIEVGDLRDRLVTKEEQIHAFSLYVLTRGASEDVLRERDTKVAQAMKGLALHSVALQYEHLQSFLSLVEGRDILRRARKLDTSTVATAMPFCATHLSTGSGALMGLTPSGGMVLIDPTSPMLENGHQLVFAKSGSGKSFFEKLGLMRQLLVGMAAVVIDPDNEFRHICARFGGSQIDLSAQNLCINPFDLGEEESLTEKVHRLLTLFDLLLADKQVGVLSSREKSHLHRILIQAYADQGIGPDRETHDREPPHMRQVYALLRLAGDEFELASRLSRYLDGWPQRTQVDLCNQLVVFNIRELKDRSEELLRVGLYLLTEFVWSRVRREQHPRPRLLLIDEAWVLAESAEGGQFLAELSRRARKYNLHLRLITQNVNDFLGSRAGQTILGNCALKMLLHHDGSALETITRTFELSEEERRFLSTAPIGQGLFFCRQSHVPLLVVASEQEYQLATTHPNEGAEKDEEGDLCNTRELVVEEGEPEPDDGYTAALPEETVQPDPQDELPQDTAFALDPSEQTGQDVAEIPEAVARSLEEQVGEVTESDAQKPTPPSRARKKGTRTHGHS